MSRGVLYFKNLDSLKSFLINKKRPIFSRKGNKIYDQGTLAGSKPKGPEEEMEERNQAIAADILKKRQYLHKTITNLMPEI
jgi:hypothetical protein